MQSPSSPTTASATLSAEGFTKEQLERKSVAELKQIAIQRNIGSGTWRQGAGKQKLVDSILAGRPVDYSVPTPASSDSVAENLQKAFAAALAAVAGKVDEDRVIELIKQHAQPSVHQIQIVHSDGMVVDVGRQHPLFDQIELGVRTGVALMLVGPVGAGKTTLVEGIAKGHNRPFYAQSVTNQTTKSDLLGYFDANGNYVKSLFRKAFEEGGIYLLDEVDKGNANVLAVLNSATANGYVAFPDGMVFAHPNFRIVASGNTWGLGRNAQFVGSQPLDGSTLDRFVQVEFGYDEALERDLAAPYGQSDWVAYVQKVRATCDRIGVRHIVSPRASINGSKLLSAGWTRPQVEASVLWKGLDKASVDKVKASLN